MPGLDLSLPSEHGGADLQWWAWEGLGDTSVMTFTEQCHPCSPACFPALHWQACPSTILYFILNLQEIFLNFMCSQSRSLRGTDWNGCVWPREGAGHTSVEGWECVVTYTATGGHASSRRSHRDDRSPSHLGLGSFSLLMLKKKIK